MARLAYTLLLAACLLLPATARAGQVVPEPLSAMAELMATAKQAERFAATVSAEMGMSEDPTEPYTVYYAANQSDAGLTDEDLYGDDLLLEDELGPADGSTGAPPVPDPFEGYNRAMFGFNDFVYRALLDPLAQGYTFVLPQPVRNRVSDFFYNLKFPIRFVNNLLQGKVTKACEELSLFICHTAFGAGGLYAWERDQYPQPQDFGLTLGYYGGHERAYLILPFFGPSSARDGFGQLADSFLWPPTYLDPWYWPVAVRGGEAVNSTSFRLGDYEALIDNALDPYEAMKDAWTQYRWRELQMTHGNIPYKSEDTKGGVY